VASSNPAAPTNSNNDLGHLNWWPKSFTTPKHNFKHNFSFRRNKVQLENQIFYQTQTDNRSAYLLTFLANPV